MVRADQGELTKLPGIATFSSLVSLGVVHDQQRAPYDVGSYSSGWSPTPRMGPCNSGYWASPSASPVGMNGRRRCCGFQGRVPCGACIFPISVWSGTACLLNRLHGLPEALHCSYLRVQKSARRRAPFLGNHNTF